LGQLAPQPDRDGRRNGAEAEQQAPGERGTEATAEEGEGEQRADDQPDRLGGEDEADLPAAGAVVRVLADKHAADRVIAADAEAEQETEGGQHYQRRGERRADRRE